MSRELSGEASELEQLLSFVYQCPSAVVRMRRDGTIDLMNAVACGLLLPLTSNGRLTNLLDVLDPVAPALRPAVAAFDGETGTIVDQVQATLLDAAGQPCVIAVTIVAVDRERCVAVMSDVTRVVQQERRLYIQEQRLQAIIDSVHDYAIFTLDPSGRVDSWNRSLARLTGLGPERVLGQPLTALALRPPPQPLAELLDAARRAGWVEYGAAHRRGGDSEFWGEVVVTPIARPDECLTGFAVVLRDATVKRRHEEELVRLAMRDSLTGVANRRAFFEAAEREQSRSLRHGHPLSVLMIDVDHFKAVNDGHGHGVGDQVLKAIAERCATTFRTSDLLGRLGGEEFALLAPETSLAQATIAAERLREALSGRDISTSKGPLRVTVSIGVGSIPGDSRETFEAALHRADEALYAAKRAGRNRVVTAAEVVV